jgi:hypothetical protein
MNVYDFTEGRPKLCMTFAENNMDIEDLHVTWFDDIVRMVPEKDFEYNKQEVYEVLGHVFHTT